MNEMLCNLSMLKDLFKGYSTFFGNRLILQLPQSWILPFSNPFSRFSDFFLRISLTRQFLVSLTSIVGKKKYYV